MANPRELKNTDERFRRPSVTDDYTLEESEEIKSWVKDHDAFGKHEEIQKTDNDLYRFTGIYIDVFQTGITNIRRILMELQFRVRSQITITIIQLK